MLLFAGNLSVDFLEVSLKDALVRGRFSLGHDIYEVTSFLHHLKKIGFQAALEFIALIFFYYSLILLGTQLLAIKLRLVSTRIDLFSQFFR